MTTEREQRLRRRADFDAVFRDGRGDGSAALTVHARRRDSADAESPCRFGFAINRRVGGAVVRNQIRRRLRESARALNKSGACRGLDVVVVARPQAAESSYQQLDAALRRLLGRLDGSQEPTRETP